MTGDLTPGRDELRELGRLAAFLAVEAGRLIREGRQRPLAVETKSSRTDVVTDQDQAAETYLRRQLAQARPEDAIFGEELGEQAAAGRSPITWVLDPIDGTVNYLYGNLDYAVSVAAVLGDPTREGQWRPIAGAVAHPEAERVFVAAAGLGSWRQETSGRAVSSDPQGSEPSPFRPGGEDPGGSRDIGSLVAEPLVGVDDAGTQAAAHAADEGAEGAAERGTGRPSWWEAPARRLQIVGAEDLATTLLATGFGYLPQRRLEQAEALVQILPRVRDIRRGGSAALDLCALADGRVDAYYEHGVNAWDIAAGWLIVTEAGGIVSGVQTPEPTPHGVLAASAHLHPPLRDLVRQARRLG